jgi:L-2-hydroxyglutarate oxidase
MKWDAVIIGGGIVGLATAMALVERRRKVCVIEAERRLARHQTGHNSGVIHSGLYYRPGSLKARNCTEGRELLYRFCEQYGIPFERCGKLVVAAEKWELPALDELERRGRANGLDGLKRLSGAELREYEPHVQGVAGLYVPQTGIVDYRQVAEAYARIIKEKGGDIRLGVRFLGIWRRRGEIAVETTAGPLKTVLLVNCGGLYSDRIARACGLRPGLKIVPFRGEYYLLKPHRSTLVKNLIYPVPDPRFPFLGIHFTRTVHGEVEAGPNAVLAFSREGYCRTRFNLEDLAESLLYPGFWRMVGEYWKTGIAEMVRSFSKRLFVRAMQRLIPEVRKEDVVPAEAGVRAQALEWNGKLVDDFRILQVPGMIHVLNAPSPAATASISIGRRIAKLAEKHLG